MQQKHVITHPDQAGRINLLTISFTFYFIFVYLSNFRGSKNRGSMDPVHERGPWTRSIS